MTSQLVVDGKVLVDAIVDRLQSLVGDVDNFVMEAADVPVVAGGGGRVGPYWILTPGFPVLGDEADLADCFVDHNLTIQVSCGAGELADAQRLASRVHAALLRWAMQVDGYSCGPFKPPVGFAATTLMDSTVVPHRPYIPLQYVAAISPLPTD